MVLEACSTGDCDDRGRLLMYMSLRECRLCVHTLPTSSRILSLSKHYTLLVVRFGLQRWLVPPSVMTMVPQPRIIQGLVAT